MCRNIRTLFNFEPPATEREIRDASLQFVRKIAGFTAPSKANEAAFERAVPLLATDAKRLDKLLAQLSPAERKFAQASGFEGAAHTHCLLPDAKGGIARVLAGVASADDPWALAALGREVVLVPENAAFAPITVDPAMTPFSIEGVGVGLVRALG